MCRNEADSFLTKTGEGGDVRPRPPGALFGINLSVKSMFKPKESEPWFMWVWPLDGQRIERCESTGGAGSSHRAGLRARQQAGLRRLKSRSAAGGELAAFWKQRG